MSASQSTTTAPPLAGHDVGYDEPDAADAPPIEAAAAGGQELPLATADLANLLANGQWGEGTNESHSGIPDANAYDGHVALALDTGVLPDIDSTLDLLTSSHDLFDVPALDFSSAPDDSSSA